MIGPSPIRLIEMVSLVDRAEENRKANVSRDRAFFTTVDNAFLPMVPEFIGPQYQLRFVKTQVDHGDSCQQRIIRSPSL